MTEDYNKVLINYLTGNLENTSSTSDEIIQEQTDIARSARPFMLYMRGFSSDFSVK